MAQRKTLTQAQLDLLQWIADGCPEGVVEGVSYRISAAALKRRGLVGIKGRGATWKATITKAGRDYLERAAQPDAEPPRQANVSVTEQLIADVQAAGGTLRVPQKRPGEDGVDYWQRVQATKRLGKVPLGKELVIERLDWDELEIKLIDGPPGSEVEVESVPVPDRVGKYHPVVRRFKAAKNKHEVSRAAMPRALRILEGLVREAERRGFEVSNATSNDEHGNGRSSWSGPQDGHIHITVRGHRQSFRFWEENLPSRAHWEKHRTYWEYDDAEAERSFSFRRGRQRTRTYAEYEAKATGRLCLETAGYGGGKWADRKTTGSLEDKLGELLQHMEIGAAEAEERQREVERAAERRKLAWEAAMEQAKERFVEDQRAKALREQVKASNEATAIRMYCDRLESARGEDAEEWVSWARAYADRVDPLLGEVGMPAPPERIDPKELAPYLNGLSPYGPDRW